MEQLGRQLDSREKLAKKRLTTRPKRAYTLPRLSGKQTSAIRRIAVPLIQPPLPGPRSRAHWWKTPGWRSLSPKKQSCQLFSVPIMLRLLSEFGRIKQNANTIEAESLTKSLSQLQMELSRVQGRRLKRLGTVLCFTLVFNTRPRLEILGGPWGPV